MQPTSSISPASVIPLPDIDSDEPVAVIAVASVAPLDGPPDGERINTFTLAPRRTTDAHGGRSTRALQDLRRRIVRKPLKSVAAAFAIGWVIARVLR